MDVALSATLVGRLGGLVLLTLWREVPRRDDEVVVVGHRQRGVPASRLTATAVAAQHRGNGSRLAFAGHDRSAGVPGVDPGHVLHVVAVGIAMLGVITATIAAYFVEQKAEQDLTGRLDQIMERLDRIETRLLNEDRQPRERARR